MKLPHGGKPEGQPSKANSTPFAMENHPFPGSFGHRGIPMPTSNVFLAEASFTMSRAYKISLILKSRSSLVVYTDLSRLSDQELEDHVRSLVRRMHRNESQVIARMVLRDPTFSLN